MAYMDKDGFLCFGHPDNDDGSGTPDTFIASGRSGGPRVVYEDPAISIEGQRTMAQAGPRSDVFEQSRFALGAWARNLEQNFIPIADPSPVGRGYTDVQGVQHPSTVSGNRNLLATEDRYGPFNDSRLSQAAIEAYLETALPSGVAIGQALTGLRPPIQSTLGFGRPGG